MPLYISRDLHLYYSISVAPLQRGTPRRTHHTVVQESDSKLSRESYSLWAEEDLFLKDGTPDTRLLLRPTESDLIFSKRKGKG